MNTQTPGTENPVDIRSISLECLDLFDDYLSKRRPGRIAIKYYQELFWIWSNKLKVFSEPRVSLDEYLSGNRYPQFRKAVLLLLGLLKKNLIRALTLFPIIEDKNVYPEEHDDLKKPLFVIQGSVDRLAVVADGFMDITEDTIARRFFPYAEEKWDDKLASRVQCELESQISKAISPSLKQRLFDSIMQRHFLILYERKERDQQNTALQVSRGSATSDQPVEAPPVSKTGGYLYPTPPIIEKGQKQVACQLCLTLQDVEVFHGDRWKNHVDQDLKPYVCISQYCSKTLYFFADENSWLEHMRETHHPLWIRQLHNDVKWMCLLPHANGNAGYFSSMEEMLSSHLTTEHTDFNRNDLRTIACLSSFRPLRPLDTCPICGDSHFDIDINTTNGGKPGEGQIHQCLEKHIGKHLKDLALFFLRYLIERRGGGNNNKKNGFHDLAELHSKSVSDFDNISHLADDLPLKNKSLAGADVISSVEPVVKPNTECSITPEFGGITEYTLRERIMEDLILRDGERSLISWKVLQWDNISKSHFNGFLGYYDDHVRDVHKYVELERFKLIPGRLQNRNLRHITKTELLNLDRWIQKRGRPLVIQAHRRNRRLIKKNTEEDVIKVTEEAFNLYSENKPFPAIEELSSRLRGINPERASLLLSVAYPKTMLFLSDELHSWMGTESQENQSSTPESRLKCFHRANETRLRIGVAAIDVEKVAFVLKR